MKMIDIFMVGVSLVGDRGDGMILLGGGTFVRVLVTSVVHRILKGSL